MENKKENLLGQREQLMAAICEMQLNLYNLEQTQEDVKSRCKLSLKDLVNVTSQLNAILEEEAKEVKEVTE